MLFSLDTISDDSCPISSITRCFDLGTRASQRRRPRLNLHHREDITTGTLLEACNNVQGFYTWSTPEAIRVTRSPLTDALKQHAESLLLSLKAGSEMK
jgi:hypothetical protein